MEKLRSAPVLSVLLLLAGLLGASPSTAATPAVNDWVSELLASVKGRSESTYAKLNYPLVVASPGCAQLLQHQWDFLPIGYPRRILTAGLPLSALDPEERALVMKVLGAVLSERGLAKVESARRQDQEIHDRPELLLDGRFRTEMYGYDKYELAIFGDPRDGSYLVTLQGHHLYLAIPVRNGKAAASTPLFFGEYPKVSELAPQEDAARVLASLLKSRTAPGVDTNAKPSAMVLRPGNVTGAFSAEALAGSIPFSQMDGGDQSAFLSLLETYLENFPDAKRADYRRKIDTVIQITPERVFFRWEGNLDSGSRNHFYVVIGLSGDHLPALALEQENVTDAKGEHIHSVFWTSGNFGGL